MINKDFFKLNSDSFLKQKPFDHVVFDNFFDEEIVKYIEKEFPNYTSKIWHEYNNALENKKTNNNWNNFPSLTYKVFNYLNSSEFVDFLSKLVGIKLYPDYGLHGGGWHIHGNGGNLNPHKDYAIHPKNGLQRKLNLIIYVSENFNINDGGALGFYSLNKKDKLVLEEEIFCRYNRAVLFDTTQESWHGLTKKITGTNFRKSLAVYYLCEPSDTLEKNTRAFFRVRNEQKLTKEIKSLIKKRSSEKFVNDVYKKNK